MIGFDEQLELFKLIGDVLDTQVECYAIGGTALMFFGIKNVTKDVDLVFGSARDRSAVEKALKDIGFGSPESGLEIYRRFDAIREKPVLLERGDTRFDLFLRDIVSFTLSPGIKRGVKERHEFGNFAVNVVSPEHVLLLKSATDRKGDRDDARKITEKHNVNWSAVLEEARWQTKHGRKIFVVFLYDFLEELSEISDVPRDFLKRVRKISEKEMLDIMQGKKESKDASQA